jgi:hypothetical protein
MDKYHSTMLQQYDLEPVRGNADGISSGLNIITDLILQVVCFFSAKKKKLSKTINSNFVFLLCLISIQTNKPITTLFL